MRKVGELELFSGEDSFNIYSDDFEKFYKDKSIELTKEELEGVEYMVEFTLVTNI